MNEFSDASYSMVDEVRQRSKQRQANLESELAQNKANSDAADEEQKATDAATAARRADNRRRLNPSRFA